MILLPQIIGHVGLTNSGDGYVKPNYLYCYEFDGVNVIESVSGQDTGINWAADISTAGYFGIPAAKQTTTSQAAIVSLPNIPVYAIGFQIVWAEIDPMSNSSSIYSRILEFNDAVSLNNATYFAFGPTTSTLTDEVVALRSPGVRLTGVVSSTWNISQSASPTTILASWNGTVYDIYVNGTRMTTTASTNGHAQLLASASTLRLITGQATDIAISGVGIWSNQLTQDEAGAVAANYREAIAP